MVRTCTKCKVEKDDSLFYTNPKRKSWCISCCRDNVRSWQNNNRDKISEYNRVKYESDPTHRESAQERAKEHYLSNKETQDYKSRKASREALRRATKYNATPRWLSKDQLDEIKDIYWLCSDLKVTTGECYEVDHVIPLKGKGVCGLHVPWNLQILPADLNRIKHNSYG